MEAFDKTPERKRPGGFLDLGDDDICQRAKKRYSRSSLALLALVLGANAVALILAVILNMAFGQDSPVLQNPVVKILFMFGPVYLVGFPCAWLIFRPMPAKTPKAGSIRGAYLMVLFLVCIFFMLAGNFIGNILSSVLSGGKATNAVEQVISMDGWFHFVFIVLVGPIVEELVFRKFLIDRVNRFGEKIAVIFSALTFALFHTNLFQFFYTFGIGLVFAYIYVRTGKIRISIIFHILVNILGGLVPVIFLRQMQAAGIDMAQISAMTQEQMMASIGVLAPFLAFTLAEYILALAGFILLLVFVRKVHFEPAKDQIPKGRVFGTVYINVGFILYFIATVGLMVYVLFAV